MCKEVPERKHLPSAAGACHCPRPTLHSVNKSLLTEELALSKEKKAVLRTEILSSSAEQ